MIITIFGFDDGKLLIVTSNQTHFYLLQLHFIHQNGSILPINYEGSINLSNSSAWVLYDIEPLAINHMILLYYNKNDPKEDLTMFGTIINSQGKITQDNITSLYHFNINDANVNPTFITSFSDISKSFVVTHRRPNYLSWTKYRFAEDSGIASPISNGLNKIPVRYPISNSTNISAFYRYDAPDYSIYAHFIRDSLDIPNEQFLLYQSYDNTIKYYGSIRCQAGLYSLNFQSNICIYFEFAVYDNNTASQFTRFIRFSSSGSVIEVGTLPNNSTGDYNPGKIVIQSVVPLPYGGAIKFKSTTYKLYDNSPLDHHELRVQTSNLDNITISGEILYDIPDVELSRYGVFNNNTLWFTQFNNTYDLTLITFNVKRVYNDFGYGNAAIISSYPKLSSSVPISFNDLISITFNFSIVPSSGNISIYQIINQNNVLLRQTYSASSYCNVYNYTTLSCPIFSSTFNQINSNYVVVADDNFVRMSSFNEPLRGIKMGIWHVMTSQSSVMGSIRLSENGTDYFNALNPDEKSSFISSLTEELVQSLSTDTSRLYFTGHVNVDLTTPQQQKLCELKIIDSKDLSQPNAKQIMDDINELIKHKYVTILATLPHAGYIDETYPFKPTPNFYNEVAEAKYYLISFGLGFVVLIILCILAYHRHNRKSLMNKCWHLKINPNCLHTPRCSTDDADSQCKRGSTENLLSVLSPNCIHKPKCSIKTDTPCFSDFIKNYSQNQNGLLVILGVLLYLLYSPVQMWKFYYSHFGGFEMFNAPFSKKARDYIFIGKIITIIIDSIPWLIIQ
ncbi:14603_t:CDS:10 [Cetraspora pellucida]|uniref:14603_t:CDS:1 n=1 Tax=Cetraspora pellucida TaxID=1433469 RepID=A0A9N8W0N4_9GLOM|nr:14603_t:CDS:10 [Cetraspora pellucida]